MMRLPWGIRESLAGRADFLGAIRLPSDAFTREGTSIVTDIVFLRKRAPGEPANHVDPQWLRTDPLSIEGVEIPINRYFLRHPEMVLGAFSRENRLYGAWSSYSVIAQGDLAGQLRHAIQYLPEGVASCTPSGAPDAAESFAPPYRRRQLLCGRRPGHPAKDQRPGDSCHPR